MRRTVAAGAVCSCHSVAGLQAVIVCSFVRLPVRLLVGSTSGMQTATFSPHSAAAAAATFQAHTQTRLSFSIFFHQQQQQLTWRRYCCYLKRLSGLLSCLLRVKVKKRAKAQKTTTNASSDDIEPAKRFGCTNTNTKRRPIVGRQPAQLKAAAAAKVESEAAAAAFVESISSA